MPAEMMGSPEQHPPGGDGPVEVTFADRGVLGITWTLALDVDNGVVGTLVERIKEGSAASAKPQLRKGQQLCAVGATRVDGLSLTDVAELLKSAARPVTLELQEAAPGVAGWRALQDASPQVFRNGGLAGWRDANASKSSSPEKAADEEVRPEAQEGNEQRARQPRQEAEKGARLKRLQRERLAKEAAEQERLALEAAEQERLAAEAAKQERLAAEKKAAAEKAAAQQERLAAAAETAAALLQAEVAAKAAIEIAQAEAAAAVQAARLEAQLEVQAEAEAAATAKAHEAQLKELWELYDVDDSGTLDQDELQQVLEGMDNDTDAATVMSVIDKDLGGEVDADELLVWWKQQDADAHCAVAEATRARKAAAEAEAREKSRLLEEKVAAMEKVAAAQLEAAAAETAVKLDIEQVEAAAREAEVAEDPGPAAASGLSLFQVCVIVAIIFGVLVGRATGGADQAKGCECAGAEAVRRLEEEIVALRSAIGGRCPN